MVGKASKKDIGKIAFYAVVVLYGFLYVYWTQFSLEYHIPFLFPYRNVFFVM